MLVILQDIFLNSERFDQGREPLPVGAPQEQAENDLTHFELQLAGIAQPPWDNAPVPSELLPVSAGFNPSQGQV